MKNYLPFFQHDSNARKHPKMKALKAEYGLEGYARFWMLNERIAESEGAFIDISKKINKLDLANELEMDGKKLDDFLTFLSDPEIDLINIKDGKITTDRLNDLHYNVMDKRKNRRKPQKPEMCEHFDEMSLQNAETDIHFDTNKIKENKIKENKINTETYEQSLELSKLLLDLHRKQIPDFLNGKDDVNIKRWAEDIEKLIRIDKKPPENIKLVIEYAKTPNNFWFPNIISGKKLREKYETLWAQLNTKNQNKPPTYKHKIASDEVTDYEQYIKKPEEDDTS